MTVKEVISEFEIKKNFLAPFLLWVLFITDNNPNSKLWSSVLSPLPDLLFLSLVLLVAGMTGNYLLTNPLLRTHDTNPYNNLLAETVVCNTPSPPAFHSPGARPSLNLFPVCLVCFIFISSSPHVLHLKGFERELPDSRGRDFGTAWIGCAQSN